MKKQIDTLIQVISAVAVVACPILLHQVIKLRATRHELQQQNSAIHNSIRATLTETSITFSKDGEISMRKVPVGSSLHVITSGEKLIRVEVEPNEQDPETDPRYASLFKK